MEKSSSNILPRYSTLSQGESLYTLISLSKLPQKNPQTKKQKQNDFKVLDELYQAQDEKQAAICMALGEQYAPVGD